MSLSCDKCGAEVLDIDVKCPACGHPQTSTSAFRMVGNIVLSQYEIVDVLGQGGMSVVYKGRHKLTDQEVALKILPPELAAMSQVKSRFVEEAKALAQLDHPNIVHLYNFGEENGCFVLAMQYIHGQTFERMILDAERLDWPLASGISIDVLRALEYAHGRGIIHRDMKPSNILVREHDGSAMVMDFGIAKMTNSTRLTATGQTMGTVRYMSPEQVRGLPVDARTDIYSLGASLFEAVCGDTPFDGDTHFEIMTKHLSEAPPMPSDLGAQVPTAFEVMLLRALAKEPEERFASARDFRKEIEGILREHAPGWSESMKLTRESPAVSRKAQASQMSKAQASKVSPATAPATPMALGSPGSGTSSTPGRELADLASAPTAAVDAPAEPAAPVEPAAPAESAGAGPVAGALGAQVSAPSQIPASDALSSAARPAGRSRMWIAVAGAVVLAAAAAVLYMTRTGARAHSDEGEARRAADQEPAETAQASAFLPPGVTFAVDRTFADQDIRVLAPEGWEAERVLRAQQQGHALFAELLAQKHEVDAVPTQPLTIAVVPQRVFCDPRVYEHGKVAQRCADKELLYRPKERTLLVADVPEYLDVNIAYGNAIAVCLHSQIPGCDDTAGDIDREFERRQR